jgi:F0F1-type ATP synthase membrane subunit c/vacuolar-type H+-ATPase subunit K
MLIKGNITLQVAAMRAGVTLGSVVVLARIGAWAVGWIADSAQESAAAQPAAEPTKQDGAR